MLLYSLWRLKYSHAQNGFEKKEKKAYTLDVNSRRPYTERVHVACGKYASGGLLRIYDHDVIYYDEFQVILSSIVCYGGLKKLDHHAVLAFSGISNRGNFHANQTELHTAIVK